MPKFKTQVMAIWKVVNQIAKIISKHQDVKYRFQINFDLGTFGTLISKATTFSSNQNQN
jgi:hypothetical protein